MVDVRNGSVIASLSVGYAPTSIALTSDGEKAYVTNWESDAVSVIDTDAFTVLKTISIEKPTSVAHSPSTPTAYVTSTNGTVTMLDTLTDTATATILVAATAESISVSTDGSIGYVSGAAPSDDAPLTVFELDLAAGRVLDEIRDDADTMYTGFIAMSPDGLFGYSAGDDGTPPTVFDIGRRVFELFDCPKCFLVWKGSGSIAVSPDSATVFTGGWVFDARSRRAVARVDLPAGATGVAVGPSWPITHLEKDRDGCHIHPGTPPNQWMLLPAIACGIAKLLGSRRRESRTKVFQPTPKSGAAENWRSAHPAPLSAGHGGHGMSVIYFHDLGHAFTMFARAGIGSVFALGLISGTALGSDPLSAESVPTLTSTPVEAKRLLCVRLVPGLPADVRREDDGRLSMVLWFRVTNDIHRCDAGTYESPYQIAPVVALDSAPEGVELGAPVQVCRPAVEIRYSGYYGWCLRYPPSLQGTEVVVQARVEGWVHPGGYDSYEASFQVVLPDLLDTATPTPTQTPVVCAGDCDGDARVSIAELMRGVEIGLGVIALADCPPFDLDKDGRVTVDELINATNRALEGCAR
jgi:YVTN family beta-propeller protein